MDSSFGVGTAFVVAVSSVVFGGGSDTPRGDIYVDWEANKGM